MCTNTDQYTCKSISEPTDPMPEQSDASASGQKFAHICAISIRQFVYHKICSEDIADGPLWGHSHGYWVVYFKSILHHLMIMIITCVILTWFTSINYTKYYSINSIKYYSILSFNKTTNITTIYLHYNSLYNKRTTCRCCGNIERCRRGSCCATWCPWCLLRCCCLFGTLSCCFIFHHNSSDK